MSEYVREALADPTSVTELDVPVEAIRTLRALGIDTVEQFVGAAQVARMELRPLLGDVFESALASAAGLAQMPGERLSDELAALPCSGPRPNCQPWLARRFRNFSWTGKWVLAGRRSLSRLFRLGTKDRVGRVSPSPLRARSNTCSTAMGAGRTCPRSFPIGTASTMTVLQPAPAHGSALHPGSCSETASAQRSCGPTILPRFWGNEPHDPVPAGAQRHALPFRIAALPIPATSVVDYKLALAAGKWVPFSIPVYNSWYLNPQVRLTGDLINPIPGETRVGGHAMCVVGCIDLPDRPELGGGRFILRNSWGTRWGRTSPYGPGYGTIPYIYVQRFGMEACCLG